MVGRKKKTKICDKGLQKDLISQLPDDLISQKILCHLSTKDAVRTSVLSTKWRKFWKWVPGLDLDSWSFTDVNSFVSFADKFFDSHKESCIRKLQLRYDPHDSQSFLTPWIDAATVRRIQHLFVFNDQSFRHIPAKEIPLSLYTCETLVHLQLIYADLANVESVFLPCLKIMHLYCVRDLKLATVEKLILGSPVLEDFKTVGTYDHGKKVLRVCSETLKRIHIDGYTEVVIDAPLLQCLSVTVYVPKDLKIINLGSSTKLDINIHFGNAVYNRSFICDFLTIVSRFRDLVISNVCWKGLIRYSEPGPLLQFQNIFRLNVKFTNYDLEMLPTILESCPKLESLILKLVGHNKNTEPKVAFSTVPRCLGSSLKLVELKRSSKGYEGEMELVRYFLKNSAILEILRLDFYHTKKAKCAFFQELVAMPRCSSACKVLVL